MFLNACSALLRVASLAFLAGLCFAQAHDVLCNHGEGSFQAQARSGVTVSIGPEKTGLLAARRCQASLSWGKQTLKVAEGVPLLDLDLFDADIGTRGSVLALVTPDSNADCCMTYRIYSLTKPPRLLRAVAGGSFFSAQDTDLDGHVEIWTDDAVAVNGFEGLVSGEVQFLPGYVLTFEHGRLLDESTQFQTFFNDIIQKVRAKIETDRLQDFKISDGKLEAKIGFSPEQLTRLRQLRATKIQVLEIIWAYLYSGREQEAWHSLKEMWPAADCDRIRQAIVDARARGIRAQLDGGSSRAVSRHKKRARIYEQSEITAPRPILMRAYPPELESALDPSRGEIRVDLVIDLAGKVRSARPNGGTQKLQAWIQLSTSQWRFIPAYKSGRPVASRISMSVSALR